MTNKAPVALVDVDTPDSQHTPRWTWVITVVVLISVAALFFFGKSG